MISPDYSYRKRIGYRDAWLDREAERDAELANARAAGYTMEARMADEAERRKMLPFDELARELGYGNQIKAIRNVIGPALSPRMVRISLANFVTHDGNRECLADAYVREAMAALSEAAE